jgi:hypothetical protein
MEKLKTILEFFFKFLIGIFAMWTVGGFAVMVTTKFLPDNIYIMISGILLALLLGIACWLAPITKEEDI